jgi:hypothetical protein
VDRVPDTAIDLTDDSELADFIFSETVGVQDWQIASTAVGRLSYLATIATDLASNERPTFHREYQRAWHEVAETQTELPSEFTVVIHRRGQIETLTGDKESPPLQVVPCSQWAKHQRNVLPVFWSLNKNSRPCGLTESVFSSL